MEYPARFSAVIAGLGVTAAILLWTTAISAAGFEVGENTPRATARGGTGAVNTASASAVYFNPALLRRIDGSEVLLSSNFLHLDAEFHRDDLVLRPGEEPAHTFDPVTEQGGIFPAPFIATSFDIGPDELSFGAGLFGPPAYGNPCWGERGDDGQCLPASETPTRGMVVETDMVVVYGAGAVGYAVDLGEDRVLDLGLTAALAHQRSDFSVVVEADPQVGSPWEENPSREGFVQGSTLSDFAPMGIFGVAYQDGPLRLAASYRPPIHWELTGTADVDFPEFLQGQDPHLSDETMHLETWHAGSLRVGWGLELGEHPGDASRPRADLELNAVWENWSVVDNFRIDLEGDIEVRAFGTDEDGEYPTAVEFQPIYQRKGYQDTISLRTGFSWGFLPWLTGHVGGFLETAAQPVTYTSADFLSWERYAGSLGASFHLPANLELDVGYTYIHLPDRVVGEGKVYNPVPMSQCLGPDYDASACDTPGVPPGNPQNEGTWRANFQILSAGVSWRY